MNVLSIVYLEVIGVHLIVESCGYSWVHYAPINVNPKGGGGRAKGGDLINQVIPWVGIWTDTFF